MFPVPTPQVTRPGARRAIVAKPLAATGASRMAGISNAVPSVIVLVRSAASAITAHGFERIRGLSEIQATS